MGLEFLDLFETFVQCELNSVMQPAHSLYKLQLYVKFDAKLSDLFNVGKRTESLSLFFLTLEVVKSRPFLSLNHQCLGLKLIYHINLKYML